MFVCCNLGDWPSIVDPFQNGMYPSRFHWDEIIFNYLMDVQTPEKEDHAIREPTAEELGIVPVADFCGYVDIDASRDS